MKVTVELELEVESVASAVQQVLYALDCEGGEDLKVLEVRGQVSYSTETAIESSTVVHNHVTNCAHTPDAISLEGQVEISRGRALPATLS